MKVNYDDLKKFLQKEYSAAQVQQILQQHQAAGTLNTQSQSTFAALNQHFDGMPIPGSGRPTNSSQNQKGTKKVLAQSQVQMATQMQLDQEEMMNMKAKQILANARKTSANAKGAAAQ